MTSPTPTKIHLIVGHPRAGSFCHALADAYARGAEAQGAEIRRQDISDMEFDPDLTHGYEKRKMLEPDLFDLRENIIWADHLAWIHPLWWGGMPAKMQGAIDRAFLPGWAFKYHDNDPWWDRLLAGKTADVIVTADTPGFFIKWVYGNPHKKRITKQILGFTGVKVTSYSHFATVKTADDKKRADWLKRAHFYGAEAGRR
ncbi:MAG: NAD(P)H-dependent oxidoreductase [Pseudomonadota bacterium]